MNLDAWHPAFASFANYSLVDACAAHNSFQSENVRDVRDLVLLMMPKTLNLFFQPSLFLRRQRYKFSATVVRRKITHHVQGFP